MPRERFVSSRIVSSIVVHTDFLNHVFATIIIIVVKTVRKYKATENRS